MKLDIEYENAIDFEHCNNLNQARQKLSQLTNILNKIIIIKNNTKKELLEFSSKIPNASKLSMDNKIVELMSSNDDTVKEVIDLYYESENAYQTVRVKQNQVVEDLLALKKTIEITPQ